VCVDRQRIAAGRTLEALGYTFDGIRWIPPADRTLWTKADALFVFLVERADQITKHNVGLREMEVFQAVKLVRIEELGRRLW
jgi:hypothetical protein